MLAGIQDKQPLKSLHEKLREALQKCVHPGKQRFDITPGVHSAEEMDDEQPPPPPEHRYRNQPENIAWGCVYRCIQNLLLHLGKQVPKLDTLRSMAHDVEDRTKKQLPFSIGLGTAGNILKKCGVAVTALSCPEKDECPIEDDLQTSRVRTGCGHPSATLSVREGVAYEDSKALVAATSNASWFIVDNGRACFVIRQNGWWWWVLDPHVAQGSQAEGCANADELARHLDTNKYKPNRRNQPHVLWGTTRKGREK